MPSEVRMLEKLRNRDSSRRLLSFLVFLFMLLLPARAAHAYIGPGAGFAFSSWFIVFLITTILAAVVFVTLPARLLVRLFRRRRRSGSGRCSRTVVIGLDGMSPTVAERMMKEGLLPHFSELARTGSFRKLRSTVPSVSPVAWSTFQTGTTCHSV